MYPAAHHETLPHLADLSPRTLARAVRSLPRRMLVMATTIALLLTTTVFSSTTAAAATLIGSSALETAVVTSAVGLPPIPPELMPQDEKHKAIGLVVLDTTRLTPNVVEATVTAIMGKHADLATKYLTQYEQMQPAFAAAEGIAAVWPLYLSQDDPLKSMKQTPPIVLLKDNADPIAMMAFLEQYWPDISKTRDPKRVGNWLTYLPKIKEAKAEPIADAAKDAGAKATGADNANAASPKDKGPGNVPDDNDFVSKMKTRVDLDSVLPLVMDRRAALVITPPQFGSQDPADLDNVLNNDPGSDPMQIMMQLGMLIQQVEAMAVWVEPGSSPAGTVQLQFGKQQIAEKFASLFSKINDAMKAIKEQMGVNLNDPNAMADFNQQFKIMDMVFTNIECKSTGKTVILTLNSQKLSPTAQALIDLAIPTREETAQRVRMSNARQGVVAALSYANNHKGDWPDSLEQMRDSGDLPADIYAQMASKDHPTFKYIKPKQKQNELKNPSEVVVFYQLKDGVFDPNGIVAFADGHVEVAPQRDLKIGK